MHSLKSFRNVSDPNVHRRITQIVTQTTNKTELCEVRHSHDERWHKVHWIHSGIFLLILYFQTIFWPFNIQTAGWWLWLSCTKQLFLFSSPGALLVQKQTHFTLPQLPLANSPAVQKNQAVICHEAKTEAGPAGYYMQKGLLTPLHLDMSYIHSSKSKSLSTTLIEPSISAAFLKEILFKRNVTSDILYTYIHRHVAQNSTLF